MVPSTFAAIASGSTEGSANSLNAALPAPAVNR